MEGFIGGNEWMGELGERLTEQYTILQDPASGFGKAIFVAETGEEVDFFVDVF